MQVPDKTYELQSQLADYCRTGINSLPEDAVHPEHVKHYRRLVYNVIEDSLSSAYPLTRKLLGQESWDQIVHEFFRSHKCRSAQVWKMPGEFYEYISEINSTLKEEYPILTDLLLFEWMEIVVFMMEDIKVDYAEEGSYSEDRLVLNPEIRIIGLNYPVHLKNASKITAGDKAQYYVLVFRNPENHKVQFMNITALHVKLLEYMTEKPRGFSEMAAYLRSVLAPANSDNIHAELEQFIYKSVEKKLILGFSKI
ncbi:MAG: DUF2063 domain-containing protein [Bacteroidetes bacterium]|nr:MAG: DUF2063 domain-containing protein [Bacteroidota bacterium]REK04773.1 MAG: DUF2063 domain-containing protein [Bacteroidota bacterium]REK36247.1 MAG: DUF2063 domain-containing protein [Bacteroidota bacterium]REK51091.1 MAG: DUF2063 domain-containing protein [Bacteroidota bacterium]